MQSLADDGVRIVVVERTAEPALVVRVSADLSPEERIEAALRLGHAFGNQHVPIEVAGDKVRIPITTTLAIAEQTVHALGIEGLDLRFESVRLASERPLVGHAQSHVH